MQEWDAFSGQSLAWRCASHLRFAGRWKLVPDIRNSMTGHFLFLQTANVWLSEIGHTIHTVALSEWRHRWDMESGRKGDSGICWRVARKCVAVIHDGAFYSDRGGTESGLAQIYEYDAVYPDELHAQGSTRAGVAVSISSDGTRKAEMQRRHMDSGRPRYGLEYGDVSMARAWPAFHGNMKVQSMELNAILCLLFHFQLMASVWQLVSKRSSVGFVRIWRKSAEHLDPGRQ